MLKAKYKGKRICALTNPAIQQGVLILLADIGIITGWAVPEHPIFKEKLMIEIVAWLQESADDLTFSEIKYALRKYCGEVKDYGKPINLSLMNNIIKMYRGDREQLSAKEEFANPPTQRIYTDEQNEDLLRQDAQICFAYYLQGMELGWIETNKPILIKDGLMSESETVVDVFKRRIEKKIFALYEFVKPDNK